MTFREIRYSYKGDAQIDDRESDDAIANVIIHARRVKRGQIATVWITGKGATASVGVTIAQGKRLMTAAVAMPVNEYEALAALEAEFGSMPLPEHQWTTTRKTYVLGRD